MAAHATRMRARRSAILSGRGGNFLIYTGPEGKPGGESRFPLSLKTDGVLKYKVIFKKKEVISLQVMAGGGDDLVHTHGALGEPRRRKPVPPLL